MTIILLLVAGFLSSFEAGDSCIDALHQLRTEERLDIVATDVLEDNVIAYTLSDGPRRAAKTATLICQRDLDAVDDGGEEDGDELEPEVPELGEEEVPELGAESEGDATGETPVE